MLNASQISGPSSELVSVVANAVVHPNLVIFGDGQMTDPDVILIPQVAIPLTTFAKNIPPIIATTVSDQSASPEKPPRLSAIPVRGIIPPIQQYHLCFLMILLM